MVESNATSSSNSTIRFIWLILNIIRIYIYTALEIFKPIRRKNICGCNVLITGSGHGLGSELAKKFAQKGANLALVDINDSNNELVRDELLNDKLIKHKIKIFTYSVDIRDEEKVAKLASQVEQDFGSGVDILINNAGMIERQSGHIVAIASIAGLIGNKYLTDYCASKFATVGAMEALDIELHDAGANENIHITTICPASMSTGMFQTLTTRFNWLLPVLEADQVANEIIDAILLNKTIVVIPKIALIMHRISQYVPKKVRVLMREYFDYGVKPHKV